MALATAALDATIRSAALASFGCADASIEVYTIAERAGAWDDPGDWFVLYVRQTPASPWESIGRRRSRAELLTLAKRGPLNLAKL